MQLSVLTRTNTDFKRTAISSAPCSALSLAGCSESNLLPMATPDINHDLREVDYTGDDWKSLAEEREVWRANVHAAMNPRVR